MNEQLRREVEERRQAEEALRASEQRYRNLYDTAPLAFVLWDCQCSVTGWNDRAERMFGWSREEVLGRDFFEFLIPQDARPRVENVVKALLRGEVELDVINENLTKSGKTILCQWNNSILRDRAGNTVGVISLALDITQQSLAEEKLRESERRFRHLAELLPQTVYEMDLQGRLTFVNRNALETFGYTQQEFESGVGNLEMLAPQERDRARRNTERILRGEEVGENEYLAQRKDGSRFPIAVYSSPIVQQGRPVGLRGIIVDITEQKKAEEALQEERNKLQSIVDALDAMDDGVTIHDRDYTIVYQNRTLKDRFGGLGGKCYRVYEGNDKLCDGCPVEMAFKDGQSHTAIRPVTMDGELAYWENTANPIRNAAGEITCCVEIGRNVTSFKDAERRFAEAKEAAEAANRAKSAFLANISHEIRTPMTSILGFADVLMSFEMPPSERQEHLETIHRNAENLLTVINDILDLSKIEAEKLDLEPVDCSPQKIVEEVRSLVQVRADEKRLRLDVDYPFPLPEKVHTDPTRLRQILLNLASNAIKFTETGGVRITVRCRRSEDARARIDFEVADTGVGMTAEELSRLFRPFTQADMSTNRRFGGTGLGLSISQKLANMLGGDIAVQSQPGKGSTFTLTIDPGPLRDVPMLQESV